MIAITMTEAILTGVTLPVGEQPAASILAGPRGPVVDFVMALFASSLFSEMFL